MKDDEIFGKVIEVLPDGTYKVETTITKVLEVVGEERFIELLEEMAEREEGTLIRGSCQKVRE